VLSWIGSIVTLGALPGLAKLLAPKSEFAESLKRCLLGDQADTKKLGEFENLFGKFQALHGLAVKGADLKQRLGDAKKVPGPLTNVEEQLKDCRSKLSQTAGSTIPRDLGKAEKVYYEKGRRVSKSVYKSIENDSKGFSMSLEATLGGLKDKLQGLPEGVDAKAIETQAEALSDDLKALDEIMRSGEGRCFDESGKLLPPEGSDVAFRRDPRSFEDSVKQQAQNVRDQIQSLKQAFDTLEEQSAVREARTTVANIKGQLEANQVAIAGASSEINALILELGPQRKVPDLRQAFCKDINEAHGGNSFDSSDSSYVKSSDKHFKIDLSEAITDAIFSQENPTFPKDCFFERDLFRGPFTLTIGGETLISPDNDRDTDAFKQKTRRFVLSRITQLAKANGLKRVDVLRNFLRTYIGQAGSGTFSMVPLRHLGDAHNQYVIGQMDHIHATLQIGNDGSCTVSHSAYVQSMQYAQHRNEIVRDVNALPCDIHMGMAYTSSLSDFTSGRPPHAIPEQCTSSGCYLDMSAMA
jgi:hypothetical protein